MQSCPDDFAMGRTAGLRSALTAFWQELQRREPELQGLFARTCLAGIEAEIVSSLSSRLLSDDYLAGLHSAEEELKGLIRDASDSRP